MRILWRGWRKWLITGVLLIAATLGLLNHLFPLNLPNSANSYSTVVLARDGQTLRAFADKNGIWRQQVSIDDVSPLYIEALLSYEDQYFWYHPGINPVSIVRAMWLNWQHDKIISGGSTISMQVARILHPHKKTLPGKLYQLMRTLQLELVLSKRQILTLYLNFAPFGGTIEGVEAASHAYLDKASSELTHAEAALLAVLPQRPSKNRPDRYPDRAQKARDKVLNRLQDLSVWSKETVLAARQETIVADAPQKPRFAPLLARYLKLTHPQQNQIQSTIDYHLQLGLEEVLKSFIDRSPRGSSGAIVVMDNQKHEILAWLGSADFSNQQRFGHVDMVRAIRSPGSTLKPFIYGLAIDEGLIHSHSLLTDAPRINSSYRPHNFNKRFSGPVSVQQALQQSLNVPAVQVLEQLGPSELYNRLSSAGVHLRLPVNSKPNLSLALGGTGINLFQLVQLYASLANEGKAVEPAVTPEISASYRHLMSSQAAWITYKMLAGNPRPDSIDSAFVLGKPHHVGWKTGTSYGFRDAWAIGVSANYTIGVWLGRPDGTPQPGHYGALNAAPLLFSISDRLHRQHNNDIKSPQGVEQQEICWPLGTLRAEQPQDHCHKVHNAWLIEGNTPPTFSDPQNKNWQINPLSIWIDGDNGRLAHFNCDTKNKYKKEIALWPRELEQWVDTNYRRSNSIPKESENCHHTETISFGGLEITGVSNSSRFLMLNANDPLPLTFGLLGGNNRANWYINGVHIATRPATNSFQHHFTQPGNYQVVVIDEVGSLDKVEFEIDIK